MKIKAVCLTSDSVYKFSHVYDFEEVYTGQSVVYVGYGHEEIPEKVFNDNFKILPSSHNIKTAQNLMDYARGGVFTAEASKKFLPADLKDAIEFVKDCQAYFTWFDLAKCGMLYNPDGTWWKCNDDFINAVEQDDFIKYLKEKMI